MWVRCGLLCLEWKPYLRQSRKLTTMNRPSACPVPAGGRPGPDRSCRSPGRLGCLLLRNRTNLTEQHHQSLACVGSSSAGGLGCARWLGLTFRCVFLTAWSVERRGPSTVPPYGLAGLPLAVRTCARRTADGCLELGHSPSVSVLTVRFVE
jgi:hypothetical protein